MSLKWVVVVGWQVSTDTAHHGDHKHRKWVD